MASAHAVSTARSDQPGMGRGRRTTAMIEVDFCDVASIAAVQRFIHDHWALNHVLSTHRELFEWQHCAPDRCNFIVARREAEILGVLGFIPTTQYDASLADRCTIALALWKIRPDAGEAGL